MEKKNYNRLDIDPQHDRYPYCIVWTALPIITWFLPFIGHTGICDSEGKIYDFAGSYYIGERQLAFGRPLKYIRVPLTPEEQGRWDESIEKANSDYSQEAHNIFTYSIKQQ